MFNINSWWLPLLLRVRFTRLIMWAERTTLDFIAWKWFHGDIADYTQVRCDAYQLWLNGYDNETLSACLNIPRWLVNNWVSIWELYLMVFGDTDGKTGKRC